MNEKGRWQMVKELRQIESLFTRTTHSCEQVMQPEWEKYGMTEDRVRKLSDEYIRQYSDKPDECASDVSVRSKVGW